MTRRNIHDGCHNLKTGCYETVGKGTCCSGEHALLVTKMIGSAYDVVKYVAMNMNSIVKVSRDHEAIIILAENMEKLISIFENEYVYSSLYKNQEELLKIFEELDGIVSISDNLPELLKVAENINEILQASIDALRYRDETEIIAEEIKDIGSDAVSQGNVPIYNTVIGVTSLNIPKAIRAIRTNGYYNEGDGGAALYKRDESEPNHAGKVQSADGAWWELAEPHINPMMFGAKGDGITDDTVPMQNALNYMRNPPVNGIPGGGLLARRNYRRRFDLSGKMFAVSNILDIDMCHGIHITNGTLIATGIWDDKTAPLLTASNASSNNFDNYSLSDLTIQCNQRCSGVLLRNSSLYQINRVYIYGWGATGSNQSFGFKTLPAGWSASSTIHNMIILPYTTWLDERPRTDYIGTGMVLGNNDCIITGCEVAAGYRAVQFLTGAAAMQFNDNHTWTANAGQSPGVEINGNFGIVLNGNYFDSHAVWIKGAGYYGITITNNFFLSGSPSPSAGVILESPIANFALRDIIITGNTGSGGMSKVVERFSPAGTSFSTTLRRVVIKDNPISTSANGGNIHPTATEGMVSVFVKTADLSANFTTRVDMSSILLTTYVPPTLFKATFSLTQNDPSMADTYVTGYYYNQVTGYLHIKLNRAVPCFVTVNFKIDEVVPNLNAVPI